MATKKTFNGQAKPETVTLAMAHYPNMARRAVAFFNRRERSKGILMVGTINKITGALTATGRAPSPKEK